MKHEEGKLELLPKDDVEKMKPNRHKDNIISLCA